MNCSNIENDHVKPISLLDVSKDKGMRETFIWKKHSTKSKKKFPKDTKITSLKNIINCSLLYLIN